MNKIKKTGLRIQIHPHLVFKERSDPDPGFKNGRIWNFLKVGSGSYILQTEQRERRKEKCCARESLKQQREREKLNSFINISQLSGDRSNQVRLGILGAVGSPQEIFIFDSFWSRRTSLYFSRERETERVRAVLDSYISSF